MARSGSGSSASNKLAVQTASRKRAAKSAAGAKKATKSRKTAAVAVPRERGAASPQLSPRRQELLAIAAETFADLGFSRATVRDVAARANILNGSLYHHFDSKESIVDELLRPYWEDLLLRYERAAAIDEPVAALVALIRDTVQIADERRNEVLILQKDWQYLAELFPYTNQSMDRAERLWLDVIRRGMTSGEFRSDLDAGLILRTIQGALSSVSVWYRAGGRIPIDEVADAQTSLFTSGLLTRA